MKKIYVLLIIFLALTGAACNLGVQASSAVPDEHSGVHQGKPGAQITLVNNQVYRLEIGVEQILVLKLMTPYSQGEMDIRVSSSEGLVVQEPTEKLSFTLEHAETYEIPVKTSAQIAGRHYVHLHIDVTVGDRKMFKSISAIVQTETASEEPRLLRGMQKAGSDENTSGDDVISLPAQEEILNR